MTEKEQKEQEKIARQKRLNVQRICNRLEMQFSFKNIKLWRDVYKFVGYDDKYIAEHFSIEQQQKQVSFAELKAYCKQMIDGVETTIKQDHEITTQESPSTTAIQEGLAKVYEETKKAPVELQPDESGFNNTNDYGLVLSPREKAFLFWFQKKATKEALDKILGFDTSRYRTIEELRQALGNSKVDKYPKPAVLVLASTGTGKTFIKGAIERRLADLQFLEEETMGHVKSIDVTRKSVVEQDKRVFKNFFNVDPIIDSEVINIEQLRTRAGQIWINTYRTVENGEEVERYEWKRMINPVRFHLDECQAVKNHDSIQHKIITKFSDLVTPSVQIYYSATPFVRVSDAKSFAIATKKDISHITGIPGSKLSESTWPTYATSIAKGDPYEYNEAAVERLMDDLDDYIIRVKNVRWQFNADNQVEVIDFGSPESRAEYDGAWNRYLIRKAKLEESPVSNPRFQALVELGIFLAAAEYCKRYIFAARMYNAVREGYAAVLAVKFKRTIIAVVKILHEKYGISRDGISLIWGGGQTQLTAKQKLKAKVMEHKELFEAEGISMEDLMLEAVEDRILEELPEELRLGIQSIKDRQREIDRFQSGKSLYCIYTYKAGGVGLSLHHSDELTKQKVKRQKNGYAIIEDIPNIPTRPRYVIIGPTWSPIELVQGCGRVPRLTSLSNTIQRFLYYRGTVEEQQAMVVTHRLKCLTKVVRQHENWMDLIVRHTEARKLAEEYIDGYKQAEQQENDDGPMLSEGEEDD